MVSRTTELAKFVVKYCIEAKPKENIIISGSSQAERFIEALYKQLIRIKANPLIKMHPRNIDWFYFKHADKDQLKNVPTYWYDMVKKADAYIDIITEFNPKALSSCNPKKIELRNKVISPIENIIFYKKSGRRTVEVVYPCIAHAIEADMSLDEWEDFVFGSELVNWKKLLKKFNKIAKAFHKGKEVHLIGKDIDIKFSIKDKNALVDDGKENLPGGEIYMAPVKKTLNGFVKFDFPSLYTVVPKVDKLTDS